MIRARFPIFAQARALVLLFAVALAVPIACSPGSLDPDDCGDGLDNDGDGLLDDLDPGCALNDGLAESPDPEVFLCDDGVDNDNDGLIDFPADPGCSSRMDNTEDNELTPECFDGVDNDGDGLIDYPRDPGCFSTFANSEVDDCPSGPLCPECSNRVDDDDDGVFDYPADPGCDTAVDDSEFNANVNNCGPDVSIIDLPHNSTVFGSAEVDGPHYLASPGCGGLGQETVYRMEFTEPALLIATTNVPQTDLDTVLYIREVCRDIDTELACNDDDQDAQTLSSTITVAVDPGTYFIVVDSHHPTSSGSFGLRADVYAGPGTECDPMDPDACPPGYDCRPIDDNTTTTTCELPACMDGVDNDFDGHIDYPNDPACIDEIFPDEHDDCPSGPNCPQCSNLIDDDEDGFIDFGALPTNDTGCESAADDAEVDCEEESDPIDILAAGSNPGTTTGYANDFTPSCAFFSDSPDRVYMLNVASELLTLDIDTFGSLIDTTLSVKTPTCAEPDLICNEDTGGPQSQIQMSNVAAGTYLIVLDGSGFSSGPTELNVHGVIKGGGTCDPALIASDLFACEDGYVCEGGSCVLADCGNGMDDDGDGLMDHPFDPGCFDHNDNDETDDCPGGPMCPSCGNGVDDDGDSLTDYPADLGCVAASDDDEDNCPEESDAIDTLVAGTTSGTTVGSTNDFQPTCGPSGAAPDVQFVLPVATELVSLTVDTIGSGFDTVATLRSPICAGSPLDCDDNSGGGGASRIHRLNVPAGPYYIGVDGRGTASGAFDLNVHGVIAAGDPCDNGLIASGLYSCQSGYTCDGVTCVPAVCNNGMDDDGDGDIDFPNDPGCENASGSDELDTCPSGGTCPQCGNMMDDDGDGQVDYPNDIGCYAASDDDEQDCSEESDPLIVMSTGTYMGNNSAATDDFLLSCGSTAAQPDVTHVIVVSTMLNQLIIDTDGSSFDTVLSVKTPTCGDADLDCDDDGGAGNASRVVLNSVAPGTYFAIVENLSGLPGAYNLNVSAVLPLGSVCDPMSDLYVCDTNQSCTGGFCVANACINSMDDDGDGLIDFGQDPGCSTVSDNDESDDCAMSGPMCPDCSNLIDDDGDGLIDDADAGCNGGILDEDEDNCPEELDPVAAITMPTTSGTTVGASADLSASCSASDASPDIAHVLNVPGTLESLTVDTIGSGFDTVLFARGPVCNTPDQICDDDGGGGTVSAFTLNNVQPGPLYLVVDGYLGGAGSYTLNVSGVVQAGAACDSTLDSAGVLSCAGGGACMDVGGGMYQCM